MTKSKMTDEEQAAEDERVECERQAQVVAELKRARRIAGAVFDDLILLRGSRAETVFGVHDRMLTGEGVDVDVIDALVEADLKTAVKYAADIFNATALSVHPDEVFGVYDRVFVVEDGDEDEIDAEDDRLVEAADALQALVVKWRRKVPGFHSAANNARAACSDEIEALLEKIVEDNEDGNEE